MRIKPLALASVCMLAVSAPIAHAGLTQGEHRWVDMSDLTLSTPLPTVHVVSGHGIDMLDQIKTRVDHSGETYVAQSEPLAATDIAPKAAVAQMGTASDGSGYGLVGVLLVLIAGGFMWLQLMQQRRHD